MTACLCTTLGVVDHVVLEITALVGAVAAIKASGHAKTAAERRKRDRP